MFDRIRSLLKPVRVAAAVGAVAAGAGVAATAVTVRRRRKNAPRLSAGTVVLSKGETYLLEVSNTEEDVMWETSDPDIAEVSDEGLITAESAVTGIATVVGHVGSKALECEVVVVPAEALAMRDAEVDSIVELEEGFEAICEPEEEAEEEEE